MTDLQQVKWRGIENVADYIDEWTYYRKNITGWSKEEILQVMVGNLRKEKQLRLIFTLWDLLPYEQQTEEWLLDRLYQQEETNVKERNEKAYQQARLDDTNRNYYEIQGVHGPAAPAYHTGGGKKGKGKKGRTDGMKGHGKQGHKGKTKEKVKGKENLIP